MARTFTNAQPPDRQTTTGRAGCGLAGPHAFLPPEASLGFAAVLIALIAGIYFGFAVMSGSGRHQFVEFNVTGLFAVTGLLGLLYWPVLLPIPQWYVPWCVVIDVIVGAGHFAIWSRDGLL